MSLIELGKAESWESLIFGRYAKDEIQLAVANRHWQRVRSGLLGSTLEAKYLTLKSYVAGNLLLASHRRTDLSERRIREIQVTNYVNALKRGGLIK